MHEPNEPHDEGERWSANEEENLKELELLVEEKHSHAQMLHRGGRTWQLRRQQKRSAGIVG